MTKVPLKLAASMRQQFHELSGKRPALGLNVWREGENEIANLLLDPSGHRCAGGAVVPLPAGFPGNGRGLSLARIA
jgi:hypothetical protein